MPFPQTILGSKYEVLINGTWTDISTYVYNRDPQVIFYGRNDENSEITAASMKLTLNNRDGRFSPGNTTGAYYPYLGRNTQIRASVNDTAVGGSSFSGFLFWGEVSAWPPGWDTSGNDVYVQIDAGGVLQRYQQSGLIGSVMRRYYLKTLANTTKSPIAYWPCEDQNNSTQFLSPIVNCPAMTFTGAPQISSDSNYPGSDPIPLVNGSVWTGSTPATNQGPTTYQTAGTFFWVATFTGTLTVECWGADGGGGGGTSSLGGGGGGGGEYGASSSYSIIQGNVYKVIVGAAGRGGVTNQTGSNGGDSDFDDGGVKAGGGKAGTAGNTGGSGGNLGVAPTHFKGGNGGTSSSTGGSGGGGRAGAGLAGGNGGSSSSSSGASGGTAGGTGGGSGAPGGANGANGNTAVAPGGGGGGAGHGTSALQQTKTYQVSSTVNYYGTDVGGGKKNTNGLLAQGVPNSGYGSFPGNQFGFAVLPASTIVSDWSGWTITDNEITLTNQNSWYNSGAYVILGWTTRTSFPANIGSFGSGDHWSQTAFWINKGTTLTQNIFGTGIAGAFAAGTAKALLIGPSYPYSDLYNYNVLNGGVNSMQLTIVGTKGGTQNFQAGNGNDGEVKLTPNFPSPTSIAIRFLLDIPTGGAINNAVVVHADLSATQTLQGVEIYYGTGGKLGMRGTTTGGSPLFDSGLIAVTADGRDLIISMELVISGSNTLWTMNVTRIGSPTIFATTNGTLTGATFSTVTDVVVNPGGTIQDTGIGHITVQYNSFDSLPTLALYMNGYVGETAADRFTRLCAEEGIASTIVGLAADTPLMGPQRDGKFTDVLQTIEDCDRGQLFERRDALGLGYRTRRDLCDQIAVLQLDSSLSQIDSYSATPDDALTRNDVIVSRTGGSQVLCQQLTGALSMQTPPNGVGDYSFSLDVPIHDDTQLQDLGNWILSVGTVNEYRYPNITVDLTRTEAQSLFASTGAVAIGDFIAMQNLTKVPGGSAKQLAFGITDTLNNYTWLREFNGVPESPYETVLNQNPYFVNASSDGWEATNGTISVITPPAGGPSGLRYANALQYVNGGTSAGAAESSDNPFAIQVSSQYQVVAWVRSSVTTVDLGFDWQDSTGTFISTSVTSVTVVANTWTRISSGLLTSPVNGQRAVVRVGTHSNTGTIAMLAVVAFAGTDIW
jgi:hypothetical protein